MHPSMRPALARRYVKSGSTRSMPSMSMSGNISPTSSSMIRPFTSMQAQFLPISPSPPRKVTTTGSGMKVLPHLPGAVLSACGSGTDWEPALAHPQTERSHHRLGGLREHARVAVLELEGLEHPGIDLPRSHDITLLEGADHVAHLGSDPVGCDPDHAARPNRQQRQRERVAAAVDLERWNFGHQPGRAGWVA